MSKKLLCGTTAVAALLGVVLFAAVPTSFIPDSTFQGSSLKGWHVLGQAGWRAEKGELIGTPKSAAGGWLMLDKSYQDIALFASFHSTGDCKTGVLLRARKTETGIEGIYVSLTKDDLASYRVTLDAQGQELSREKLRPSSGHGSVAPRFAAPPRTEQSAETSRGGRSELPKLTFNPEEWSTIQIFLDADILRPTLEPANGAAKAEELLRGLPPEQVGQGARALYAFGNFNLITGGATDDNMAGYGPVALYAGGSGEVRFKDVAFKDLNRRTEPVEQVSSHFKMERISDYYYAWGAGVADVNHDGVEDIVAPPYYYPGPKFTERREFMPGHTFDVSSQYTNDMIVFAHDFTGDGWPDVVSTFTNGRPLYLYVNPKGEPRRWDRYVAVPSIGSEVAVMRDVDGDGMPDIVYGTRDGGMQFASPNPANPTGPWKITNVSGPMAFNPHGVGVGDINGDGRMDVLGAAGWWEQPAKGAAVGPWKFHAADFGAGGAEMCVYDVNGDGLNDVVTAVYAHQYGISWYEQKRDGAGKISFVEHKIMGGPGARNAGNVLFSQAHATACADMDGDGIPDLVVGKRIYSHQESYGDPDPYGTAVLYWYRTVRNPKAPGGAEFVPELIHNRSGVGSNFVIADVNHDGAPDIVTSVDKGTFVFFNELRAGRAAPAPPAK